MIITSTPAIGVDVHLQTIIVKSAKLNQEGDHMQKVISFLSVLSGLSVFNMIFQFFYLGLVLQLTWALVLSFGVLVLLPVD